MHKHLVGTLVALILAGPAYADADEGIVTKKSAKSVTATMDCLEKTVRAKGLTVFTRVNHTAGAVSVGLGLRPTELLVFGNPKVGTPLMQSNQLAGIDLPLKVLAWEDEKGQVWVSYNDPAWIATRHGIGDRAEVVKKMTGALGKFTDAAAAPAGC